MLRELTRRQNGMYMKKEWVYSESTKRPGDPVQRNSVMRRDDRVVRFL
jgi:hypothetical protein